MPEILASCSGGDKKELFLAIKQETQKIKSERLGLRGVLAGPSEFLRGPPYAISLPVISACCTTKQVCEPPKV